MNFNDNVVSTFAVVVLGSVMGAAIYYKVDGAKDICLALGGGIVGFLTRGGVHAVQSFLAKGADEQ